MTDTVVILRKYNERGVWGVFASFADALEFASMSTPNKQTIFIVAQYTVGKIIPNETHYYKNSGIPSVILRVEPSNHEKVIASYRIEKRLTLVRNDIKEK